MESNQEPLLGKKKKASAGGVEPGTSATSAGYAGKKRIASSGSSGGIEPGTYAGIKPMWLESSQGPMF